MAPILTPTLFWLVLTIAMTGLLWVPYIAELLAYHGPINALRDPDGAIAHGSAWSVRAKRAHYNAVENLVVMAPLVLLAHLSGLDSPLTAKVTQDYFWLRLGHFTVYTLGIPFIRTVLFLAGALCQAAMVMLLLGLG